MRQHPAISAEIVGPLFDEELVAGVRHHHERFDGGGYPDGLAGEAIPLMARAMCVADCYDAMSSDRPYHAALTYKECLAELRACAGEQFAPDLVPPFVRCPAAPADDASVARKRWPARRPSSSIPAKHALLRTRADEARPEYQEMVTSLRELRDANPPVRFVTSFALVGGQCVTVLDTGETEGELSHLGEPWFAARPAGAGAGRREPAGQRADGRRVRRLGHRHGPDLRCERGRGGRRDRRFAGRGISGPAAVPH